MENNNCETPLLLLRLLLLLLLLEEGLISVLDSYLRLWQARSMQNTRTEVPYGQNELT